jgi:hypothetical protein
VSKHTRTRSGGTNSTRHQSQSNSEEEDRRGFRHGHKSVHIARLNTSCHNTEVGVDVQIQIQKLGPVGRDCRCTVRKSAKWTCCGIQSDDPVIGTKIGIVTPLGFAASQTGSRLSV